MSTKSFTIAQTCNVSPHTLKISLQSYNREHNYELIIKHIYKDKTKLIY